MESAVGTKQDKLPYPTNAIPYSAISDMPQADITLHPVTNNGEVVGYVLGDQTNKVVSSEARMEAIMGIKQDKLPYPTNAIPYSAISDAPPPVLAVTNRYPLFIMDLNPGEERIWNGIELKATTNNYSASTASNMIFFTATSVNGLTPAEHELSFDYDWCRLFILSRRASSDIRRWVRITNTGDLNGYAPLSIAIIVDPSMLKRGQGDGWLHEGNDELIWSYVRIGLSDTEKDQDGQQCWRPAMPVRWYRQLPQWANETPITPNGANVTPYVAPWEVSP